ncbi:uncharacterized protein LOC111693053, partial [Anoplophora glabripennis]|uniref:uncharacterized protein LOC111693053 n=1 Tax=Anoplophora glabripennis TaxID=217634 RepID=UPI000C78888F
MFNKDKFIKCIQDHPSIWKRGCKEYTDRNLKEDSWIAIGEIMFDAWDEISDEEKQEQVKEMKTKWRHMRDSFGKYMNQVNNGDPVVKKKKYMYADALSFLLQSLNRRRKSGKATHQNQEDDGTQFSYENDEVSGTDEDIVETVLLTDLIKESKSKLPALEPGLTILR